MFQIVRGHILLGVQRKEDRSAALGQEERPSLEFLVFVLALLCPLQVRVCFRCFPVLRVITNSRLPARTLPQITHVHE